MTTPPSSQGSSTRPDFASTDFARAPFTVAWEITRACALACIHCRAEAQPRRDGGELSTAEAFGVIDQIVDIGGPILIVTGGDPLMRPDCFEIIERAASRGLRVAFSPSATARCTRAAIERARDAGVSRIQISLDGPDAASHDAFRGVRGSFERTLRILESIQDAGLALQVGTTVSRHSIGRLPEIARLIERFGPVMWSVFFLVPTGRGEASDMVSAEEHEWAFNWLYDAAKTSPYDIRTTAAMAYRRVVIQRRRAEVEQGGGADGKASRLSFPNVAGAGYSFHGEMGMSMKGVNDGDGFAFIDHTGNVCPSGFLPLSAGNLREQPFANIYRGSQLFRDLRDRSLLKGKCAVCEYRPVCGGSRARAYALTGDYLASDPSCVYEPHGGHAAC
ncbi:MAG: radical SAM/SPASM domain-containing protein [Anaerolinea sp.]|nr:radical SAM/SPASM domain-containing protein [Anaerolinea sp.]